MFIVFRQGVIDDGNGDGFRSLANFKRDRAALRRVIRSGFRRVVMRRIIHGDYTVMRANAVDSQNGSARIFLHRAIDWKRSEVKDDEVCVRPSLEPGDVFAGDTIEAVKEPRHNDLTVDLQGQRGHGGLRGRERWDLNACPGVKPKV